MIRSPVTRLVGAGPLFFACWGLLDPRRLARRMGIDETGGRQVGVRTTTMRPDQGRTHDTS